MRVRQQRATGPTGGSEVWKRTISFIVFEWVGGWSGASLEADQGKEAKDQPGVNAQLVYANSTRRSFGSGFCR